MNVKFRIAVDLLMEDDKEAGSRSCCQPEHNGDPYSCDHFVEPKYLLGNVEEEHVPDMVASDQQRQFGNEKYKI
jgi:radical SAM protein with 4Fe4S-binding SPASM domain